jgi:hypothetical protein
LIVAFWGVSFLYLFYLNFYTCSVPEFTCFLNKITAAIVFEYPGAPQTVNNHFLDGGVVIAIEMVIIRERNFHGSINLLYPRLFDRRHRQTVPVFRVLLPLTPMFSSPVTIETISLAKLPHIRGIGYFKRDFRYFNQPLKSTSKPFFVRGYGVIYPFRFTGLVHP